MKPMTQEQAGPVRLQARELYCRGDIPAAIGIQRTLLEATRADAHPGDYLFLATMLWATGDHKAVRDVMLEAHGLWPDVAHFIDTIGVCEAHLLRWSEAIPWLERGLELNPDNANLHDCLARVHGELGDRDRSREHGERALMLKDALAAEVPPAVALDTVPVPPFRPDAPERNVISFSLFGAQERYCLAAVENARVAPHLYPGWRCRFYCDASVPEATRAALLAAGAGIVLMPDQRRLFEGLFWRFHVANDPEVDRYLVRDCDSLLNLREQRAVQAWIDSGRHFHVMRDYFSHTDPMLAGLWGGVRGALPELRPLYDPYLEDASKTANCDQRFLRQAVWPTVRQSVCSHDSTFRVLGAEPFPDGAELPPGRHVGQDMVVWRPPAIGGVTDRTGGRSAIRRRSRFIYALTTTSGEARVLAEFLAANLPDAEVHHRRDAPDDAGARSPEASVIRRFNTGGGLRGLRGFWRRKLAFDLHGATDRYVETDHTLPLAGLIENLDLLGDGIRADIVALRRPEEQILRELMATDPTEPLALDPHFPQNIVDAAPYLEAGRLGLSHWYATEMAARASYYFHLLSKHPTIRVHWIGLEALCDPAGAARFLGSLGRPAEVTTLRLSEGLTAPASPKDAAEVQALMERLPLQSRRRALEFLQSGRRLGRPPPARGPSRQASSG